MDMYDNEGGVKILIKRQIRQLRARQIIPFNILNGSEQFINALKKVAVAELVTHKKLQE